MNKQDNKQKLFEVMLRLDRTFKPRLNESSVVTDDPSKEEMQEFLRTKYRTEDDFDIEAAIYWFANGYHGGQNSNLYSALSTSEFRPSPMSKGIEDEESEMATMMYQDLVDNYGGAQDSVDEEIHRSKYGHMTISEPIIPDAIQVISDNPEAIQFLNKQEYDNFANQQKYFSASHSHAFYSPEEMEQWRKSGNQYKDKDSELSDILFDAGHEVVQVWDNKNRRGYVVPSKRNKENLKEEQDEFIPHGTYTVSNAGGYEIMLSDDGDQARVRDAFGSDNPETSDWLEIEWVSGKPVIDPYGYNIPMSQVMRIG